MRTMILCLLLGGCMYKPMVQAPKMPPAKHDPRVIHNMDCKKEWGALVCKS